MIKHIVLLLCIIKISLCNLNHSDISKSLNALFNLTEVSNENNLDLETVRRNRQVLCMIQYDLNDLIKEVYSVCFGNQCNISMDKSVAGSNQNMVKIAVSCYGMDGTNETKAMMSKAFRKVKEIKENYCIIKRAGQGRCYAIYNCRTGYYSAKTSIKTNDVILDYSNVQCAVTDYV
ncbi:hypothetical protein AYI68_g1247 [Smittium mucronatum]|uniref:Uncharacterized protein n=1 Tax=Smittium mucronatum TaxID=133383 RepID=A0A1R0H672_9FUNG|nr:hypothetical protein AYI68_g1247 [Smittium mucronatum]